MLKIDIIKCKIETSIKDKKHQHNFFKALKRMFKILKKIMHTNEDVRMVDL